MSFVNIHHLAGFKPWIFIIFSAGAASTTRQSSSTECGSCGASRGCGTSSTAGTTTRTTPSRRMSGGTTWSNSASTGLSASARYRIWNNEVIQYPSTCSLTKSSFFLKCRCGRLKGFGIRTFVKTTRLWWTGLCTQVLGLYHPDIALTPCLRTDRVAKFYYRYLTR